MNFPVSEDPFIMEERDPTKSNALSSSLWEIVALQKHAIPSVAIAARFISQPLPNHEWDLSSILEVKEDDVSIACLTWLKCHIFLCSHFTLL